MVISIILKLQKKFDTSIVPARTLRLDKRPLSDSEMEFYAGALALFSKFDKRESTINMAGIWADPGVEIPERLSHNVALVHAEEWLHGLQHLVRKPLTGVKDLEADIAYYMMSLGVPLTDDFLGRHGRRESLKDKLKLSNSKSPKI